MLNKNFTKVKNSLCLSLGFAMTLWTEVIASQEVKLQHIKKTCLALWINPCFWGEKLLLKNVVHFTSINDKSIHVCIAIQNGAWRISNYIYFKWERYWNVPRPKSNPFFVNSRLSNSSSAWVDSFVIFSSSM